MVVHIRCSEAKRLAPLCNVRNIFWEERGPLVRMSYPKFMAHPFICSGLTIKIDRGPTRHRRNGQSTSSNSRENTMQKIADQIIENGKIATLAPGDSMAEAIAITEDKILAVGSTSEVDFCRMKTPADRCRRPLGHTRSHRRTRAYGPGRPEGNPPIPCGLCFYRRHPSTARSPCRRNAAKGEWIVTMPIGEPPFYFGVPENLKENKFPNRHDLDRVAPDPQFISGRSGDIRNTLPLVSIANTKALEVAGIDRNTMPPPAPSIQIEQDLSTGDPSKVSSTSSPISRLSKKP